MIRHAPWLAAVVLIAGGCVLRDVDLDNKRCDCASGWVCDSARDVCVREDSDAGDTGSDAGLSDAGFSDGGLDAGASDAGASDAGASDAGASDASSPDAGLDDTICDEPMSPIFCDGFEMGLAPWVPTETDGSVAVGLPRGAVPPYRGRGVLSAHTTGPGAEAAVQRVFAPVRSGTIYVRAYVNLTPAMVSERVGLIFLGANSVPFRGVTLQVTAAGEAELYLGTGDVRLAEGVPFPQERWVCVQLKMDVHDTVGTVSLRLDGVLAAQGDALDTNPARGVAQAVFGVEATSPTQFDDLTYYVDEVAISRSLIPCD